MNVLIIPEDSRKNKYVLLPLFRALFKSLGKSRIRVRICEDPVLGGVGEALKSKNIEQIIQQYKGMTDIFILCIDRDGNETRQKKLDQRENKFGESFLAVNAWEEIEIWVLAGIKNLPDEWPSWSIIRTEVHVKENYFDKLVVKYGITHTPGGGRKELTNKAAREINRIRQLCPEDFDNLAKRLEEIIKNRL